MRVCFNIPISFKTQARKRITFLLLALASAGAYVTTPVVAETAAVHVLYTPVAAPLANGFADAAGLPGMDLKEMSSFEALDLFCSKESLGKPLLVLSAVEMSERLEKKCEKSGLGEIARAEVGFVTFVLAQKYSDSPMSLTAREIFAAVSKYDLNNNQLTPSEVKTWATVNPSLPDLPIKVILPSEQEQVRKVFNGEVLVRGCRNVQAVRQIFEADARTAVCLETRDGTVSEVVGELSRLDALKMAEPGAIAILTNSEFAANQQWLRMVPFEGMLPTPEDVVSEDYTLATPVFLYAHESQMKGTSRNEALRSLVQEIISEQAIGETGYSAKAGLISVPAATREWQRRQFFE